MGRAPPPPLGWYFRRQHPIGSYVLDFACVSAGLIVEADGGQHAEPGEHALRDRALTVQGWRVLRFWNAEILENLEGVLIEIKRACEASGTPSLASPASGGREAARLGKRTVPR